MIKHEIYVSREKSGMGHNNAAALIKKAAAMANKELQTIPKSVANAIIAAAAADVRSFFMVGL